MADNDQNNDEYKFAELDSLDNDSMGTIDSDSETSKPSGRGFPTEKKDVKRNALVLVCLIVFGMIMYKFVGPMFSGKSSSD